MERPARNCPARWKANGMNDVIDMSRFIEAKSDQLNADDLIGAPRTITITRVTGNDGDQPVSIFYEGDGGKPFKPCKTIRRVMMGVWSHLRQFMYTKFIVVVDADVDVRDWKDVIWAITTRMDPARDTMMVEHTPIDYLDFASPVSGLGGKMGLDATNKWPAETSRPWSRPITLDPGIERRVDELWRRIAGS